MLFTKVSAQQNKNEQQREQLNLEKDSIISVERAQLKLKVEKINRLLRKKEVSEAVADSLKADAALVNAIKINNQNNYELNIVNGFLENFNKTRIKFSSTNKSRFY